MEITTQKQTAIDRLVNETVTEKFPKATVIALTGSRYTGKHTYYQQYLLSNGHTAFVNLSRDPMTCYLSEDVNKKAMAKEARAQARRDKKEQAKLTRETKAANAKTAREEKQAAAKVEKAAKKAAKKTAPTA